MGRQALRITILLGILISLVGGTGIFAVFTDRATGGQDSVTSAGLASAADIRIDAGAVTSATDFGINCDPDGDGIIGNRDDITTPQFSATDVRAGADLGTAYVCIENAGSAPVSLVVSEIELIDTDTACTGDEAAAGDANCGGNLAGELSPLLFADTDRIECMDSSLPPLLDNAPMSLSTYQQTVAPDTAALQPNATACFAIHITYPDPGQALAQVAQSDQATWRFAFDAATQ